MSVLGALALCPRFGAMIGLIAATAHRIVVKILARITAASTRAAAMNFARTVNMRTPSAILRSEEHTSELQSLMRISYAVFCLKKKKIIRQIKTKCKNIYSNDRYHNSLNR